jgi:hypothetical protein
MSKIRHNVFGFTDEMVAGDTVTMKIESIALINGALDVKWNVIRTPDQRKMAESAANKVETQDAFAIASAVLCLTDAVKDATGALSSIDDALRNTVGGTSRA